MIKLILAAAKAAGWKSDGDSGLGLDESSDAKIDAVSKQNLKITQVYSKPHDYLSSDSETDEADGSTEIMASGPSNSCFTDSNRTNQSYDHTTDSNLQAIGAEDYPSSIMEVQQDSSNEQLAIETNQDSLNEQR